MSNVDDDPELKLDPEHDDDHADLELDGIALPASSPYRRVPSMAREESVHRTVYELDGLDDDFPDLLQFPDPLDDLDW